MKLLNWAFKQWKLLALGFIVADLLAVLLFLTYTYRLAEARQAVAAELLQTLEAPTLTPTATATPWPGPGPRPTATPTSPPTPLATDVLAQGGFPPGFTPTPRPTREPVMITLPYIYPVHAGKIDLPVINQIYYPEPFFAPGTNNACGPVALYAAVLGLGANIDYTRLRNIAVNHGFTDYGISTSGMVGTISTLNQELGSPYTLEHGKNYNVQALARKIRQGGVAIVLLNVRKVNGQFIVTPDKYSSFGHFLIVESINMRTRTVQFAGSTLGMDKVPLDDFVKSWSSNPQALSNGPPRPKNLFNLWQPPADTDAVNWALILKKS